MGKDNNSRSTKNVYRLVCVAGTAILFALYFYRSFVLYVDVINPVTMEECHTGAIAREVLDNGFRFPIEQYTPEYYESSIIVAGLLTVVPVAVMGLSQLSVEMTPFILSFATMLLFCSILLRGRCGNGAWFFIVSYFFASGAFVCHTMDSVGSHMIGLFMGVVILHQFYYGYTTRKPLYIYTMMFAAGLGLFMHISSALYAGLCLIVYIAYKPAQGRRPCFGASVAIKGSILFALGAIPFIVFLIKTKMMSVIYIFSRRSLASFDDWEEYWRLTAEYMLLNFGGQARCLTLYFSMALLIWAVWGATRKHEIPEEKRFLCYIACLFPFPVFAAVITLSGGEFTAYHVYLLPLLFLAGAVVFSTLQDKAAFKPATSVVAQGALSVLLTVFLLSPGSKPIKHPFEAKPSNLSLSHAIEKLTKNEDRAYCYWRFGRAFGNHVRLEGDNAKYAADMLAACGRLEAEEKIDECLWGWSAEAASGRFKLDDQAAKTLGGKASIVARSVGGWSGNIMDCASIRSELVDECVLGIVERAAIMSRSQSSPEEPAMRIPCQSESPHFSGLVGTIQAQAHEGSLDDGPQDCPDDIRFACLIADAYCAAVENRMFFCDVSYESLEDRTICNFVFDTVWSSRASSADTVRAVRQP